MAVDIKQLIEAIKKHLWRHAWHQPERVKHVVAEDGSHTVSVTFKPDEAHWKDPHVYGASPFKGLTTPGDMHPSKPEKKDG